MEKSPQIPNTKERYNTKIKCYKDGSYTAIYTNTGVFLPKNEIIISEDEEARKGQAALGRMLSEQKKEKAERLYREFKNSDREIAKQYVEGYERQQELNAERCRSDNMKRAIDKVYDIAFQNDWSFFITCTIKPNEDFDRDNPQEVYEKLRHWLKNNVSRNGLQYLIIPEYHPEKNEGIHFHGLVNDVLPRADSGRTLFNGKAWRTEDLKAKGFYKDSLKTIYNLSTWKYGYTTAIPVSGSPARLACYITKYITKDCKKIFGKYYLSSRNIRRDVDTIICNSDKFSELKFEPIQKFGLQMKYESDFKFSENSDINPTEGILKYLSERGAL